MSASVSALEPGANNGNLNVSTINSRSFLNKMTGAAQALEKYSFQFEISLAAKKEPEEHGNFYFMKPGFMRIEETGSYKHGAVAVVDSNGKIRGHLGGALSSVVMNLKPDSQLLRCTNGWPLVKSDYLSIAQAIEGFSRQGHDVRVYETSEVVQGVDGKVYVMDISAFERPEEPFKRFYVDSVSMLPVVLLDYKNGRVWARSVWKNVSTSIAMSDTLFDM